MSYPNSIEIQRQNEMRRIADAQNRLAMLDQQAQIQSQQNQYMNQNGMNFGQPQVQFLGINGKFIQVPENITANDVPMDGSVAIFPKQDMSEIICKAWNANGTINTTVYRPAEPVLDAQANNSTPTQENSLYEAVNNALDGISEKVDTLTSRFDEYIGKPKTNARAKKETETNE